MRGNMQGGRVIHKFGAKVTPLAVHEFGTGEATAALSLACWLVRRSEIDWPLEDPDTSPLLT